MAVYRAYPCPRGAPRPTGRRAARILSGHRHWRLHVAAVAVWWTRTGCPQPGPWTGTPTEHADFTATTACHGGHVITHQKMARAFQARSDDPALRCFFFSGAPLRRLTSASLKMLTFMTMLDIRCGRWIGPTWYTSASPTPLRPKCTQQDGRGTRRRTACQTTDVISVEGCAVGAPNRHSDYFVGLTVGRP